jgi:hypothetical protein
VWQVVFHPDAEVEFNHLPERERIAMLSATDKLTSLGPEPPFPHQSSVRGAGGSRDLRPRARRSPVRALYQRIRDVFVIAAVGPEADVDRRGFERAVRNAGNRLLETQE